MKRITHVAATAVVAALLLTAAGCAGPSKPTGIVTRSAAEGAGRYDPVLKAVRDDLDAAMPGERWELAQTDPQQLNGRCVGVVGTWRTLPSSGLIPPKEVKAAVDPVLEKHGFSATEVMSTEGPQVQLGAVEPGGASFTLTYDQKISLAIYYATSPDRCKS